MSRFSDWKNMSCWKADAPMVGEEYHAADGDRFSIE